MESAIGRVERRGRKRRRNDVQNVLVDRQTKKRDVETRSKALVGRYVQKEFEGSGVFLGKIVYYDTGLYRIDYEDGDCEDLESGEVREFLVSDDDFNHVLKLRKKKLDDLVSKKYEKGKDMPEGSAVELAKVELDKVEPANIADKVEAYSLSELSNGGANDEIGGVPVDCDADSSSDSCEDLSSEVEAPLVPPPQLPLSSGNIGVPEEYVPHLLSVYSLLRSFSVSLFLSPFGLDDFVGLLNCSIPNTLLDAIHVVLMRALRRHLEALLSDGSELASKCLRCMDWCLLDTLTWPVYLVHYLMIMGYTGGPEWKGFYIDALERDYYTLSVGRKLIILQILCDDVLESAEVRAEIDMREESEVGIGSDGVPVVAPEDGPRRVHPRYSKTSACKDQEAMHIIVENHDAKLSCNSTSLSFKSTGPDGGADIDQDGNGDECRLCGMDGTLLCCDGCPSAYHSRCIGVSKMFIPDGAWYCPECTINKCGPVIARGTSLRGAEVFGIDLYEQVFLGTCNHLLVLNVSFNSEPCTRYYNQNEIPGVIRALNSSVHHIAMYSGICKGILQYWEIPDDFLSLAKTYFELGIKLANKKEDGKCSVTSLTLSGSESHNVPEMIEGKNIASSVTESSSENVAVSCLENICKQPGFNETFLDTVTQPDHPGQQRNKDTRTQQAFPFRNTRLSEHIEAESTMSADSGSLQVDPSDLTKPRLADKSSLIESATHTSGYHNASYRGLVNGTCVVANMSSQSKEANYRVGGRVSRNLDDDCLYIGSSFKPQAYINYYTHGDFAASAAANLAVLSSEENRVSGSQVSDNYRKVLSANVSLQVKAFSSAAIRFFWPNAEKKLVEVPRERCGWCLSCKAPVSSKKGCLLNAAASNAIKGSMKILAGLRPLKNGEGSLPGIATYVMFMGESLCGLTVGPFLSVTYRKQWRKQLEQATTCCEIKTLLLELEENLRIVALSGDWVKLVDNWPVESSVTQSATSATGSIQRRGPIGRRRKQSATSEVTADDGLDTGFIWWRGSTVSKLVFQKGTLPCSLLKKAARQGGSRKIPGIYYVEGFEIPKRSRQFVWRAAVEMSKNASQLALQVRYLDLHLRWSDLVRPEQILQDGKAPETEASAFRNAFVFDKRIVENKIRYGVAFGNQKHLPSRVLKNILEVEQSEDGKEKYWFLETRIPLYLIKEYEENVEKVLLPPPDKHVNVLSKLQRRQLKASRKDIVSYLSRKRDNLDKCCCASCQLDVLLGAAVTCSACQGYCHEDCTVSSSVHVNEEVEFLITCQQCCHTKAITQNQNNNESPTSPLLLQGDELQNTLAVSKGGRQSRYHRPLASIRTLERSSEMKLTTHDSGSGLAIKSSRRSCNWGLIWKKKNTDTGIDFRINNILLKGNPNMDWSGPVCHLCYQPYNSDLMYIHCETCKNWYHAEAVNLEESKIFDLVGFKCCKCRRIKSPVCPYMDPDMKKDSEGKKARTRAPKQGYLGMGPDSGTISDHLMEGEPATPELLTKEEVVYMEEDDPLLSISWVEQVTEHNSEVDFERNAPTVSGPGPQKLPVRRQMKREKDLNVSSAINPSPFELSTPSVEKVLNPAEESSSPRIEWDVSTNGFEENMMFDYGGLDYSDMEFEPQTYFSFTELLASDDGGQLDGVDPSEDGIGNWENPSALSPDCNPQQYGMAFTYDQQEPTISIEPAVDVVLCQMCSDVEPYPDLCCQICGLLIHSHCSPWVESSSGEGGWSCGHCREWR